MTTAADDTPVCQWCQHPLTPANTSWWDRRPQCANPHACDRRTRNRSQT
jgi:hypothetical protein